MSVVAPQPALGITQRHTKGFGWLVIHTEIHVEGVTWTRIKRRRRIGEGRRAHAHKFRPGAEVEIERVMTVTHKHIDSVFLTGPGSRIHIRTERVRRTLRPAEERAGMRGC